VPASRQAHKNIFIQRPVFYGEIIHIPSFIQSCICWE